MAKKPKSRGVRTPKRAKVAKALSLAGSSVALTSAIADEVIVRSAERYVRRAIWWAMCGRREYPPIQPKIPESEFDWLKPPNKHLDFGKQPLQPQTWSFAFDHTLILLHADGLFPTGLRPNEASYWFTPVLNDFANFLVSRL